MHAHNDLGMAVANSISAVEAGAGFIDCTTGGIGERAGNCDFFRFAESAAACLGVFQNIKVGDIYLIQNEITRIIRSH